MRFINGDDSGFGLVFLEIQQHSFKKTFQLDQMPQRGKAHGSQRVKVIIEGARLESAMRPRVDNGVQPTAQKP